MSSKGKKNIVIFGYCSRGKEALYLLDYDKYNVVGFVDNNQRVWGKSICGLEVKSPDDLNEWQYDYIVVVIPEHADKIREQLCKIIPGEGETEKIIIWNPIAAVARLDNRIGYLGLCAEQIQKRGLKGACAELGVYKGEFAKYINRLFPERKLYLFDTFEGFGEPELLEEEKSIENLENLFCDTSENEVLSKMITPENCIVRKGFFPGTADGLEESFVFVSLDADLYSVMLAGLEYFYPRLVSGGYIFVHDYGSVMYTGTKEAVDKFCEKNAITVIPVLDVCASCILVKN